MSRVGLLALLAQYVGAWKFEDGPGRSWEVRVPRPHTSFAVLERRRHRLILRRDSSCVAPRPLWQGPGVKPKIVCQMDACNSLWSMGVREDQLVGYFGFGADDVTAWSNLCHGGLCMGVHFEQMESISLPGEWNKVDLDKLNALSPDIIVDNSVLLPAGGLLQGC